jgi:hypothetical protein
MKILDDLFWVCVLTGLIFLNLIILTNQIIMGKLC